MNQSLNLNESAEIAQKKLLSFLIVAFNYVQVWSNTNVLVDCYLSLFKSLKGIKTFYHTEIVNNKIHENVFSPGCPCHSLPTNEKKGKSKFIKPECGKFYWVRYEFQCEKVGTIIKVLRAFVYKRVSNDYIYIYIDR